MIHETFQVDVKDLHPKREAAVGEDETSDMGGFSLCMSKCQEDVIRGAARKPRGAHDSEAHWGKMAGKVDPGVMEKSWGCYCIVNALKYRSIPKACSRLAR